MSASTIKLIENVILNSAKQLYKNYGNLDLQLSLALRFLSFDKPVVVGVPRTSVEHDGIVGPLAKVVRWVCPFILCHSRLPSN